MPRVPFTLLNDAGHVLDVVVGVWFVLVFLNIESKFNPETRRVKLAMRFLMAVTVAMVLCVPIFVFMRGIEFTDLVANTYVAAVIVVFVGERGSSHLVSLPELRRAQRRCRCMVSRCCARICGGSTPTLPPGSQLATCSNSFDCCSCSALYVCISVSQRVIQALLCAVGRGLVHRRGLDRGHSAGATPWSR